jgi:serine protease
VIVTAASAVLVAGMAAGALASSRGGVVVRSHGRDIVVQPHGRFGEFLTHAAWKARGRQPQATQLRYGGGVDGIGVTTGAPKVYIIYWGTQWGTSSINGNGYTQFSNDSAGYAPDQQAFFKGVGTASEQWSGVVTQYCEGVAAGTITCPTNVPHVGYPTGGALTGVWYDNSGAAPGAATQAQLAAEAVRGAAHFGNTNSAANRNAQYIVTSPKGTNPDNYKTGGFCAWHDYTTSQYGDIAYTNMPYLLDVGASCGQNFVNGGSAGTLDGVTIVGGHEYAETITDQNPAGGWTDTSGEENADKCAWISQGQGASQDITLTTGTFAVQSSWANDFNNNTGGCLIFHSIFNGGGGSPDFTISASPSSVSIQQGSTGHSTITTTVANGFNAAITLSSKGLPSGATASFSPNPIPAPGSGTSTMTITVGSSTPAGTYPVTVTGTGGGVTHTTSVSLTVTPSGGGGNLLVNPGFENGLPGTPWVATSGVIDNSSGEPAHSGSWKAWLDGYGGSHTDTLYQQLTLPGGSSATLSFYLHIDTAETTQTVAYDKLQVQIRNSSNQVLATLATYSNLNHNSGYLLRSFNVSSYLGQTIRVYLVGTEDSSLQTSFVADDFSLTTS